MKKVSCVQTKAETWAKNAWIDEKQRINKIAPKTISSVEINQIFYQLYSKKNFEI